MTPCLNPGDRLVRCIDSVASQSKAVPIEHIIVDGGSQDGTLELLQSSPDLRWISEPDRGQSDALAKGFAMSSGKFLTWINADDVLLPGAVETVMQAFGETDAGWVYGDCLMWNEESSTLWRGPDRLDADSFDWVQPFPQQGWFFARWAYEQVGGIDTSFDLTMDYDLIIRLFDAGIPYAHVPQTLAKFEVHGASKTGSRGFDHFMVEAVRALRKSGRERAAQLMLGQIVAERSFNDGRSDRRSLRRAAEHMAVDQNLHGVARRAISAAALTRMALLTVEDRDSQRYLRGLRHLLTLEPWAFRTTRTRAISAARTALGRLRRDIRPKL